MLGLDSVNNIASTCQNKYYLHCSSYEFEQHTGNNLLKRTFAVTLITYLVMHLHFAMNVLNWLATNFTKRHDTTQNIYKLTQTTYDNKTPESTSAKILQTVHWMA